MIADRMRCLLFVPGNRPDRFERAAASGADGVCIDLEDAVAPGAKSDARRHAADALAAVPDRRFGIRINPPGSAAGRDDLEALSAGAQPAFVIVPKFEHADDARAVVEALGSESPPLIPLVETARGLLELQDQLDAALPLAAVMFGGYDFSVDAGCAFAWQPLLWARGRLVVIAAAHGLGAIDVPYVDLRDRDGLASEARDVRDLGFTGKAAVHPDQVGVIQDAFTPSPESVAHARRVIAAADDAGSDAVQVDGRLVDAPVVEQARRTLARAGHSPNDS